VRLVEVAVAGRLRHVRHWHLRGAEDLLQQLLGARGVGGAAEGHHDGGVVQVRRGAHGHQRGKVAVLVGHHDAARDVQVVQEAAVCRLAALEANARVRQRGQVGERARALLVVRVRRVQRAALHVRTARPLRLPVVRVAAEHQAHHIRHVAASAQGGGDGRVLRAGRLRGACLSLAALVGHGDAEVAKVPAHTLQRVGAKHLAQLASAGILGGVIQQHVSERARSGEGVLASAAARVLAPRQSCTGHVVARRLPRHVRHGGREVGHVVAGVEDLQGRVVPGARHVGAQIHVRIQLARRDVRDRVVAPHHAVRQRQSLEVLGSQPIVAHARPAERVHRRRVLAVLGVGARRNHALRDHAKRAQLRQCAAQRVAREVDAAVEVHGQVGELQREVVGGGAQKVGEVVEGERVGDVWKGGGHLRQLLLQLVRTQSHVRAAEGHHHCGARQPLGSALEHHQRQRAAANDGRGSVRDLHAVQHRR